MVRRLGMTGLTLVGALLAVATGPATADAAYDLQITEIWMGQNGTDVTEDWFELTNYGDMPWTAASDGDLYFDDVSAEPLDAVLMSGIAQIDPYESVAFVDGDAAGATGFHTVWDPVKSGFQVGYYEGAGLGQGGDAVTVWVGDPTVTEVLVDFEDFPDTTGFDGKSYDVALGAFSTVGNASGAVATLVLGGNLGDTPAVGSPGMMVPEPSSIAFMLLGAAGLLLGFRRK